MKSSCHVCFVEVELDLSLKPDADCLMRRHETAHVRKASPPDGLPTCIRSRVSERRVSQSDGRVDGASTLPDMSSRVRPGLPRLPMNQHLVSSLLRRYLFPVRSLPVSFLASIRSFYSCPIMSASGSKRKVDSGSEVDEPVPKKVATSKAAPNKKAAKEPKEPVSLHCYSIRMR